MFSGLFFWFFLLNMKIKRFRLNPMLYVFSGLFHHQIPSNGSRKHFKINYMSQVRACLSLHEYTPRKLKELVATRFDNIVGSCYNKIWRNILSVRKWLWPTKEITSDLHDEIAIVSDRQPDSIPSCYGFPKVVNPFPWSILFCFILTSVFSTYLPNHKATLRKDWNGKYTSFSSQEVVYCVLSILTFSFRV